MGYGGAAPMQVKIREDDRDTSEEEDPRGSSARILGFKCCSTGSSSRLRIILEDFKILEDPRGWIC